MIFADPPVDRRLNEMLLADAEKLGYVGKRVGDVVTLLGAEWWTVTEILPAIVHAFRDVTAGYEQRFQGEPFWVRVFKMPNEPSVRDLVPILQQLHARKSRAEEVFAVYREHALPFGFVAQALGVGIADVMLGAMSEEQGLVLVEWSDAAGYEIARVAARNAREVVVARSALETLAALGLLETFAKIYTCIVPQTLLETLEVELIAAEEKRETGQRVLMAGEPGLRDDEIPPEHPVLVATVDRVQTMLAWIRAAARVELRPLEVIAAANAEDEEMRARVGAESIDAAQLSHHLNVALFADDLGLRKLLSGPARERSFSTVSLLDVLAERAVLGAEERDRFLLQLIERRYVVIPPTRSLLVAALNPLLGTNETARRAFALLGGPGVDLTSAARIASEVLRDVATAPLHLMSVQRVTTLALEAMSAKWPPRTTAVALNTVAATQLMLLPTKLREVQAAIVAFLKDRAG